MFTLLLIRVRLAGTATVIQNMTQNLLHAQGMALAAHETTILHLHQTDWASRRKKRLRLS